MIRASAEFLGGSTLILIDVPPVEGNECARTRRGVHLDGSTEPVNLAVIEKGETVTLFCHQHATQAGWNLHGLT